MIILPKAQLEIPPITPEELKAAFSRTAKRKATGVDHLENEHLSSSFDVLATCWHQIFNHCLKNNVIPEQWKESLLVLLYKNRGEKDDPKNY